MRSSKLITIGTSAVVAGVLMLGLAYMTSGTANAGNIIVVPCDATATATPQLGEIQAAFQRPPCTPTPIPTETPGRLKTQTPSATPTATSTMAPSTPAATNTAAPTNTPKPASGNEGVAVKPPNTGSGGAAPGNGINWFLGLGALLVLAGGGAALVGVKQRR